MSLILTDRDFMILEALVFQVRFLTVRLVAELWWPGGINQRQARKRLEQLSKSGLLEIHVINARPLMQVAAPLVTWKPNDLEPEFEMLSEQARDRWERTPQPTTVCVASKQSASLLGNNVSGLPAMERWDYDLRLCSVFAKYQMESPASLGRWVGSQGLLHADERLKKLDAWFVQRNGHVTKAIKSAGRNDAERLKTFHQHCSANNLPYELW